MAIIKCLECGQEVSNKAKNCPNFSYGVADYFHKTGYGNEKNRINNSILFIDASNEYIKVTNNNKITEL